MSGIFFRELGMPAPDRHLDVGSGSHAEQTAIIMVAFGKVLTDAISDLLFVTEESTRGPARGSRTSCWGGDLGGSNAAAVGLTGFLCTGRMDSVGNEIWPEGGREGYR